MYAVEVYASVRQFVFVQGRSQREAARVFGLSRETIGKICRFSLPPGYTRTKPVEKPKLGPLLPVVDAILEGDRTAPVKQRHTAKRIFERLRDEYGSNCAKPSLNNSVAYLRSPPHLMRSSTTSAPTRLPKSQAARNAS